MMGLMRMWLVEVDVDNATSHHEIDDNPVAMIDASTYIIMVLRRSGWR
jgi:hypothetical protein